MVDICCDSADCRSGKRFATSDQMSIAEARTESTPTHHLYAQLQKLPRSRKDIEVAVRLAIVAARILRAFDGDEALLPDGGCSLELGALAGIALRQSGDGETVREEFAGSPADNEGFVFAEHG